MPESKVTQPTETPKLAVPKYGFNRQAERLNGRAAMVGLFALLLLEYLTGKSFLSWLGLG